MVYENVVVHCVGSGKVFKRESRALSEKITPSINSRHSGESRNPWRRLRSQTAYCAFETFKISSKKPAHRLYGATYGLLFVAKPRQ